MKGYKFTTKTFIQKAIEVHGNKYDYSKVNYITSKDDVDIICPKHGSFSQRANNHLLGNGCKKCNQIIPITQKTTTDEFIQKAKKTHGDRYNYSLVKYIGSKKEIKIKCKNNHIFSQRADSHLKGHGCKYCTNNFQKNTKLFIEKAKEIHGDLYDYSLVDYKYASMKVKIICKKHGVFETRANNHLSLKRGCPNCRKSRNEDLISKLLTDNNIKFKPQKTFEGCKYKYSLSFDFYLPNFNTCIEYDGKQHYFDIYNCPEEFKNTQLRDKIKNKFCKDNNIKLLRIKYGEDIENIIKKELSL